jgi:hypothetical protein
MLAEKLEVPLILDPEENGRPASASVRCPKTLCGESGLGRCSLYSPVKCSPILSLPEQLATMAFPRAIVADSR